MTKKELAEQMKGFLATLNNTTADEWYCTHRELAADVFADFAEYLKMKGVRELLDETLG